MRQRQVIEGLDFFLHFALRRFVFRPFIVRYRIRYRIFQSHLKLVTIIEEIETDRDRDSEDGKETLQRIEKKKKEEKVVKNQAILTFCLGCRWFPSGPVCPDGSRSEPLSIHGSYCIFRFLLVDESKEMKKS